MPFRAFDSQFLRESGPRASIDSTGSVRYRLNKKDRGDLQASKHHGPGDKLDLP